MGIPVFTSPYQHQHSVAEFILANLILLARKVGDRSQEIHSGLWNKLSKHCQEVRNKTLGIVGYGHVGSQLGVMAEALSLKVLFYDCLSLMPLGRAQPMDSLTSLLEQSDFVSINISCTEENKNLFSKEILQKMKKDSYLINTSFGEAVDLDALAEYIQQGHLKGAAIDVYPESFLSSTCNLLKEHKLTQVPNVILSFQLAKKTQESTKRCVSEVTASIVQYIQYGSTVGAVNYPSIAAWPLQPNTRRIINVHRNVRGVLKEIDYILSAYNVGKQVLETKDGIGYFIADVNTENVTSEIVSEMALLANAIRTRIL
jgi:D-3-phosphoglycerate dehydrogenase